MRTPLSRDRVLRAAVALADQGGIEALSMRKLAQELGVEAMSLYNHVTNKDDILDGIVELVAGEIDLASEEADWKAGMRRRAVSAHEVLTAHSWAASLWMSRRSVGGARMSYAESVLRGLRQGGFSPDLTYHAFHVLRSYVMGVTLQERNLQFEPGELKALAERYLSDFPADEFPELAEHVRQHMEPSEAHGGTFEFGLELVLDGLERLRDSA